MFWIAYNILFALVFLLVLPHFLLRMRRRGGYAKGFAQRFALYSPDILQKLSTGRFAWVHAVSVGELFVAQKFMKDWRARQPGVRFVLTVNTSTAHALAAKQLPAEDILLYFPADFPWIINRALETIRPFAVMLMEVELWPNLIRLANKRKIPVALINGRLSDRSFRRYAKVGPLCRRVLPLVDAFCMQSEQDAERMIALGAPADRVRAFGTAKYDVIEADRSGEAKARALLRAAGVRDEDRILLGGSTWDGEEDLLLDTFKSLRTRFTNLVLVLVPRHVERTAKVLDVIKTHSRTVVRRSTLTPETPPATNRPDVFLLDTTGELKNFYSCADVIFIGKSLTQHGGQNIIEPALYGKAILVGPNMENFAAVMDDFRAAKAIAQVTDLQDLRRTSFSLFADDDHRRTLGEAAARLVTEKSGSLTRTLDLLAPILKPPT